jgi:hypothetical protein
MEGSGRVQDGILRRISGDELGGVGGLPLRFRFGVELDCGEDDREGGKEEWRAVILCSQTCKVMDAGGRTCRGVVMRTDATLIDGDDGGKTISVVSLCVLELEGQAQKGIL